MLWRRGRIAIPGVQAVFRRCIDQGDLASASVSGLVQDAVRRRLVSPEQVDRLLVEAADLAVVAPEIRRSIEYLGELPPAPAPAPADPISFLEHTA